MKLLKLVLSICGAFALLLALSATMARWSVAAQSTGLPPSIQQLSNFWGCTSSLPLMGFANGTPSCVAASAVTAASIADAMQPYTWYNAVTGTSGPQLDNTGTNDVSAPLQTWVNGKSAGNWILVFPCGTYKFTNGVVITANNSNYPSIAFVGLGTAGYDTAGSGGCVKFQYNGGGANPDLLWDDNTTSNSTNYNGPLIAHITFQDTSGTGAVHSLLRVTQFSNGIYEDIGVMNAVGQVYTTGTVAVTNGSTSVTGTGTAWASIPNYGTEFQIQGHIVEVASINGAGSLTLTSPWDYATAPAGSAYAVDSNGVGILLEGNSSSGFTQYDTIRDIKASNIREAVHMQGGPSGATGAYDITIDGGYIDCNRVTDSGALFNGAYNGSDTYSNFKINNCGRFLTSEASQAQTISFRAENTGAWTPITTCNGLVNTSGTSVTWVSGVPAFNTSGSWSSGSITIAGTAYTISSVTSSTTLTLSSSAGTQTNASYTMPHACTAGIVFNNSSGLANVGTKNKVIGATAVNTGNGIEFDVANTVVSHAALIAGVGFTSNLNNYVWGNGTTGCSYGEQDAVVLQPDCTISLTGFTGTKTAGSCTFTINGGIVTGVSGC